ncbi:MAG: Na+/H+ antiporter subunit E [Planctomycetes bacterium]|jgi:multicomponent Na+:H+ antiporter subunit E|nr:Na+/H+ antiporter subunit E [Planctomycetota bacterium]
MFRVIATFVFAFLVYLAVTWSLDPASVLIGAAASLAAAVAMRPLELEVAPLLLLPHRLLFAVIYVPVLLWYVIRANLDVAYRVIHPKLPIRPGIVKARTTLKTAAARVLLANSITLTPGTLTVDLVGDALYIHRIAVPEKEPEAEMQRSIEHFEGFIRRILE